MRRTLTSLLALTALVACGDEEGSNAHIRASFDGQIWSAAAEPGIVVYSGEDPDGAGRIFTIASRRYQGGTQFLSLNLPEVPTVGSYPLDGHTTTATFASCPNDVAADCIHWTPVAGHPGTLTIDRVNASTAIVEGNFSFTGYALGDSDGPTKLFTAGHFRFVAPIPVSAD
jgi:hypothetical protein